MKRIISILFVFVVSANPLSALRLDVQHYSLHSHVQFTWAILALDLLPLNGDESILDVGCADGKLSAYLASLVPQGSVEAIDPEEGSVMYAQDHFSAPNLAYYVEDAASLPYDECFDVVTAFCVLNWIDDQRAVFANVAKALKPGGYFLAVLPVPDRREMVSPEEVLRRYKALAEEAGLEVCTIQSVKTPAVFHDREEVKNWFLAIQSDLRALPPEQLDTLVDQRIALARQLYPQANDGRLYAFPKRADLLFRKRSARQL